MSLADKQREELIKERGEPVLRLEFDVFDGNKVSMWTHFNHNADFSKTKQQLLAIRDHLNEFLRDENMCPFHKADQKVKPDAYDKLYAPALNPIEWNAPYKP